jgi:hypothetical protein
MLCNNNIHSFKAKLKKSFKKQKKKKIKIFADTHT